MKKYFEKYTKVCYFDDLDKDELIQTIQSLRQSTARPDEDKIVAYIKSGWLLWVWPCVGIDYLKQQRTPTDAKYLMGDGVYIWTRDLGYWVSEYHIKLPEEFVENMRANNWTVPANPTTPNDGRYLGDIPLFTPPPLG